MFVLLLLLLQVLADIGGPEGGAAVTQLERAIAGTAALQAQLGESEAANYELAGMVKDLSARLAGGQPAALRR